MRAARVENGIVVGVWIVPSLTAFEGVELFPADDSVSVGNLHDGVVFTLSVEQQAEIDKLAATAYARNRAEAYPSLTEQADMAYWDRQNGTTTLDDAISAVKAKFPKPV